MVPVLIDNRPLTMELDTGAAVTVISETTFRSMFGNTANLQQSKELPLLGTTEVQVQYESQHAALPLFVIKGQGGSLLSQNWLKSIHINWSKINLIDTDNSVEKLLTSTLNYSVLNWVLYKAWKPKFLFPRMHSLASTNHVLLLTVRKAKLNRSLNDCKKQE